MALDAAIDITAAERETILALLQQHLPGTVAWVYGSRVTGASTPKSDLDLVVFATPEQRRQVGELREAFEESNLPFRVDLFVWDDVPESFRKGIAARHAALLRRRSPTPPTKHEHVKCSRPSRPAAPDTFDKTNHETTRFGELFSNAPRNGLTRPKAVRGSGTKMVNMGELFAYGRLDNVPMDRVPLGQSEAGRFLLKTGDLLFARQSLVLQGAGKCSLFLGDAEPVTFESHVTRVRLDQRVANPNYYFYYLQSHHGRSAIRAIVEQGAGASGIRSRDLATLDVLWRPLEEQRAIAHILGTLDDKIELNRRMNATLEAMARALFRSWFVDFDPVRAKMEGRDTGLPKKIADLFPDRLVGSELGDAPEGWNVESLAEHFDAVKGVSYKGSGLGDGMPLHNLNSVHEGGGYKYDGIKFYAGDYADRHVVRPGDVIVANTEQGHDRLLIGYAAIVPNCFGEQGICSHHVYRLRLRRGGDLSTPFLHQLLNSPWMHDIVSRYANGTTVNMLPMDAVQRPIVLVPPRALLDTFDALALDMEHRREQAVQDSRSLAEVRDALLPKLVSGELRVDGLELATGSVDSPAPVGIHGA